MVSVLVPLDPIRPMMLKHPDESRQQRRCTSLQRVGSVAIIPAGLNSGVVSFLSVVFPRACLREERLDSV